jgi:hypothetical protein
VTKDDREAVSGTAWDLPVLEPHAELVSGPLGRYWVAVQPAGSFAPIGSAPDGDVATPYPEASLTLELLGVVLNRVVHRGRWSARVVVADEHGRATRKVIRRDRVAPEAVLTHARRLQDEIEAGRLPASVTG